MAGCDGRQAQHWRGGGQDLSYTGSRPCSLSVAGFSFTLYSSLFLSSTSFLHLFYFQPFFSRKFPNANLYRCKIISRSNSGAQMRGS